MADPRAQLGDCGRTLMIRAHLDVTQERCEAHARTMAAPNHSHCVNDWVHRIANTIRGGAVARSRRLAVRRRRAPSRCRPASRGAASSPLPPSRTLPHDRARALVLATWGVAACRSRCRIR
eukprot:scaffold8982_cov125-Isochrysis_galbana.AAC.8